MDQDDDVDDVSTAEDAWDILTRCHKELRNICKRGCRGRYDLVDELMGRITDMMHGMVSSWDPTQNVPLRAHVYINAKWYVWKWMNRRMKREVVNFEPMLEEPVAASNDALILKDQVQVILSSLEDWESEILEMYFIDEMPFTEIAEELGLARGVVRNRFMAALERAKELHGGHLV